MNVNKSNSSKKKVQLIIIAAIIAAVLTGGTIYALLSGIIGTNSNEPSKEQLEEQKQTDLNDKEEFIESTKDQDLPGTNPTTPSSSDSIKLSATVDPGMVTVKTELQGFSAGTCELTATNNGQSVIKSADIIYQPEFSTCAGFTLLRSELNNGTWNISLKISTSGDVSLTKSIEVVVQ